VAIASSGSSAQAGNIGVGFAIPSEVAKRIAKEIMTTGKASHALLGAGVADSTNSADNSGFSVGAKIKALTAGGAAELGGLKVGDVVVKFNGQPITTAGELTAAVRQEPAGAKAQVEVLRDSKPLTLNVVLGDAADLK
jgi:putative serine protease PepD